MAATTSAMVFDRRFRLPMVQQGTLSLEHEVGWGVLGSARYVMNLDRQLPNSVDINIAPSTDAKEFQLQGGTGAVGVQDGETFAVPVYSERVSTELWAGDGRGVERERELQRADAGGAARNRRGTVGVWRRWAGAGVSRGVDVVEGDRLWAERGRGAAANGQFDPFTRALRQRTCRR